MMLHIINAMTVPRPQKHTTQTGNVVISDSYRQIRPIRHYSAKRRSV